MTKPMRDEDKKKIAGPHEGKLGYWEPDIELEAMLHAIEISHEEYRDKKTGKPRYWTEERSMQVMKEFIEWARQPEAISANGFFPRKGLHDVLRHRLCKMYPRIVVLYKTGLAMVGHNREKQAGKKFDSGMAKKYAAVYSADYKDWELKIRDLDAKANSKEITVNVRGKMAEPILEEEKSEKFQAVKRKLKDKSDKEG